MIKEQPVREEIKQTDSFTNSHSLLSQFFSSNMSSTNTNTNADNTSTNVNNAIENLIKTYQNYTQMKK